MTRAEWESEWTACYNRLRAQDRDVLEARRMAAEITTARYGPQPANPPLWLRLGLSLVERKFTGLGSVEVSPMLQRVIVAVTYGIGAASPIIAQAFADGTITGGEWGGILTAFGIAFWGTFKSNTTVIAPDRTVWTPAQRTVEVAKIDAAVVVQDAKVFAAEKVADAKAVADANKP
jgi:hypothetical protein